MLDICRQGILVQGVVGGRVPESIHRWLLIKLWLALSKQAEVAYCIAEPSRSSGSKIHNMHNSTYLEGC